MVFTLTNDSFGAISRFVDQFNQWVIFLLILVVLKQLLPKQNLTTCHVTQQALIEKLYLDLRLINPELALATIKAENLVIVLNKCPPETEEEDVREFYDECCR